jgi:DNA-binding IclR family transcriptional regulator
VGENVEVANASGTAAESAAAGTLVRGLDILEWVAASNGGSMVELCVALGLSRSAAYRIVGQLRERGYLAEGEDNRLRLGPSLIRLGLQALSEQDLHAAAPAHLRQLMEETEETAFIGVHDEDEMVYVMQEVGPQAVKVLSKLGSRAPLHATGLGKAWLSALPDTAADEIIARLSLPRFTPTTITTPAQLRAELARIRAAGYAIDDAEREPGVRCIAAPIRGPAGAPIAAVSVAGPRDRILASQPDIAAAVCRTAALISAALGGPEVPEPT